MMKQDLEKLNSLILSGNLDNIQLAFEISKSTNISNEFELFIEEKYISFIKLFITQKFSSTSEILHYFFKQCKYNDQGKLTFENEVYSLELDFSKITNKSLFESIIKCQFSKTNVKKFLLIFGI